MLKRIGAPAAQLFICGLLATNAFADNLRDTIPGKEAAAYKHSTQLIVNLGIQNGGNEIIGLYDNASGEQVDSLRAGGFWLGQLGANIALGESPFSLQMTGGVLYGNLTSNVNADKAQFKRKVFELIPFWNFSRYRLGAGATLHKDPEYHVNLDGGESFTETADDATGLVLQADVRYDQNLMVGMRVTNIKYEFTGTSFNGNAFGIHVTASF